MSNICGFTFAMWIFKEGTAPFNLSWLVISVLIKRQLYLCNFVKGYRLET